MSMVSFSTTQLLDKEHEELWKRLSVIYQRLLILKTNQQYFLSILNQTMVQNQILLEINKEIYTLNLMKDQLENYLMHYYQKHFFPIVQESSKNGMQPLLQTISNETLMFPLTHLETPYFPPFPYALDPLDQAEIKIDAINPPIQNTNTKEKNVNKPRSIKKYQKRRKNIDFIV